MKSEYTAKFNDLLSDIAKGTKVNETLDLSAYGLDEEDVDKLIQVLPKNSTIKQIELGKTTAPFSKVSKLRQLLRQAALVKPISTISSDPSNGGSSTSQYESFTQQKTEAVQKDAFGNNPQLALFEMELALAILKNTPLTTVSRINKAIIKCIEQNPEIIKNMEDKYTGIKGLLIDEKLILPNASEDPIHLFKSLLSNQNLIVCMTLHKLFFENFFIPLSHAEKKSITTYDSTLSLSIFAQKKLNTLDNVTINKLLIATLRPDLLFSEQNRGRRGIGIEKWSQDFGIADDKHTPAWARDWHQHPVSSAKNIYRRDNNANIVKFCEQYDIPFIAGPSGTVTYCLIGLLQLLELTPKELKEYVNLLAAVEIALGHHSFFEVMRVAANLKLFYCIENQIQLLPKGMKDSGSVALSPTLDPTNLYDSCLTEAFKQTFAYQTLTLSYPEYIGKSLCKKTPKGRNDEDVGGPPLLTSQPKPV